jgi:hypothetical protein
MSPRRGSANGEDVVKDMVEKAGTTITRQAAIVLACVALLLAGLAGPVGAAPAPPSVPAGTGGFNFGVRPWASPGAPVRSAFTFDVAAGQTVSDRVELVNSGDSPKPFYVYASDAYTTEIGGGFALHLRTDPPRDAAAWTTLPVNQYTVPARSAALVPFQITTPADATPGDHTAAVVAEEVVPPSTLDHGAGVVPVHRVAARVYLRVQGPIHPALQIERLTVSRREPVLPYLTGRGSTTVTFSLVNAGNVRTQLDEIDFRLTGAFGRGLRSVSLKRPRADQAGAAAFPEQVIPGSRVQFSRTFDGLPPLDAITAAVTVRAEDSLLHGGLSTSRATTFWVVPWLVLGLLAAAGLGLVARRKWRRRRAGRPAGGPADLGAEPWDDLPVGASVGP